MENKKAIILLSSGLDSLISLAAAKEEINPVYALTFDYGQKAAKDEIFYSKKIAESYGIQHEVIELPFLKKITNNLLTKEGNLEFEFLGKESMKAVWVPNRNGLFLNIATSYADSFDIDYIIFGANKEESETFLDNSKEFIETGDKFFELSTLKRPKIYAPLQNLEKFEIVQKGVDLNVDFTLLKSCYDNSSQTGKKHCGKCESCKRLYNAIIKSQNEQLLDIIF